MDALIVVDVQNDFLPGGALPVPQGDEVIGVANRIQRDFQLVVATQDWHPANHGSFASQHADSQIGDQIELAGLQQTLWPDHCIQGTPGADFPAELECGRFQRVFRKGTDVEVDSYSGFFDNGRRRSTGLAEHLRAQGVEATYILGLATDYCVRFTALDSVREGFATHVLSEGCRGVELEAGDIDSAVAEMRDAGVWILERWKP